MNDIEEQFERVNEAAAREAGHVTQSSSWTMIMAGLARERERRRALWLNGAATNPATPSLTPAIPLSVEEYRRLAAREGGGVVEIQSALRTTAAMMVLLREAPSHGA